jgi:hypothetical protein
VNPVSGALHRGDHLGSDLAVAIKPIAERVLRGEGVQ